MDRDDTATAEAPMRPPPVPGPVSWRRAGLGSAASAALPLLYTALIGPESAWLLFWMPATATLVTWFRSRYRHRWPAVAAGLVALAVASVGAWAVLRLVAPGAWALAIAAAVGSVAACYAFATVTKLPERAGTRRL